MTPSDEKKLRATIRHSTLFAVMIATGVVVALMALAQLWFAPFGGATFGKALATAAILGTMVGFIAAIDLDMPIGKARFMLYALIVMGFVSGVLIVVQMWWAVLAWESFGKIIVSMLILAGLIGFYMAVSEDFGNSRKLKDDKYID